MKRTIGKKTFVGGKFRYIYPKGRYKHRYGETERACSARLLARNNEFVRGHKEKAGCEDCKGKFPHYVLDFDHVKGVKTANVSRLVINKMSLKRIKAEMRKCEVVCANCHKKRTWKRLQESGTWTKKSENKICISARVG